MSAPDMRKVAMARRAMLDEERRAADYSRQSDDALARTENLRDALSRLFDCDANAMARADVIMQAYEEGQRNAPKEHAVAA